MELNYLRAFYEVAKVGNFTEAAKRLYISQSALSRSVALLEENEKVQLFDRSRRGVTLTPTGVEVFRHCEQLFQKVQQIEGVCRGVSEICEGPLRFAATDHVINYLLVSSLQAFREEFPLVLPSVMIGTPDEVVTNLLQPDCEFGLSFAKILSPQIAYEAIKEEPMSLVVQTQVWKETKDSNPTSKLDKILSKVGYISSVGAAAQSRPSRVLNELFGKMPPIGIEANSQEAQKRLCLAGGGVAYLSRFMVDQEIKSGALHEIDVEEPHKFNLWLATRKGSIMSLAAKTFLARLRKALE